MRCFCFVLLLFLSCNKVARLSSISLKSEMESGSEIGPPVLHEDSEEALNLTISNLKPNNFPTDSMEKFKRSVDAYLLSRQLKNLINNPLSKDLLMLLLDFSWIGAEYKGPLPSTLHRVAFKTYSLVENLTTYLLYFPHIVITQNMPVRICANKSYVNLLIIHGPGKVIIENSHINELYFANSTFSFTCDNSLFNEIKVNHSRLHVTSLTNSEIKSLSYYNSTSDSLKIKNTVIKKFDDENFNVESKYFFIDSKSKVPPNLLVRRDGHRDKIRLITYEYYKGVMKKCLNTCGAAGFIILFTGYCLLFCASFLFTLID